MSAALVSNAGTGTTSSGRTCHVCWFHHDEGPTVRAVVDAISAAAGMDSRFGEQLHVIGYTVGGQYKPHFDGYRLDTEIGQRCTRRRGQRTHTAILYLNDGMTGGATIFPRLGLEIPPAGGAVLTVATCVRGTVVRVENSLYAGGPVEEGEMDRYPVVQGARRPSNRNPRLPDMDKGPGSRAAHDVASLRLRSRDGPLELPLTSI